LLKLVLMLPTGTTWVGQLLFKYKWPWLFNETQF
jgi:hypothetical protein